MFLSVRNSILLFHDLDHMKYTDRRFWEIYFPRYILCCVIDNFFLFLVMWWCNHVLFSQIVGRIQYLVLVHYKIKLNLISRFSTKNGSQRCWVMPLKSSTKREEKFCCIWTLKKGWGCGRISLHDISIIQPEWIIEARD